MPAGGSIKPQNNLTYGSISVFSTIASATSLKTTGRNSHLNQRQTNASSWMPLRIPMSFEHTLSWPSSLPSSRWRSALNRGCQDKNVAVDRTKSATENQEDLFDHVCGLRRFDASPQLLERKELNHEHCCEGYVLRDQEKYRSIKRSHLYDMRWRRSPR